MATSFQYARNIIVAGGNHYMRLEDYARYEQGTLDALLEIMKNNWTGYGIIQSISELSGKEVIITPNFTKVCKASAGMPSWKNDRQIEIVYSPQVFGRSDCSSPGFTTDEALLHELVHAYRQLRHGIKQPESVYVAGYNYDDFEEFVAVLLTNIYASKKKRPALRKDHREGTLPAGVSQSDTFMKKVPDHARAIRKLIGQEFYICSSFVRKDDGPFNPVDYFLRNSEECVKLILGDMVAD